MIIIFTRLWRSCWLIFFSFRPCLIFIQRFHYCISSILHLIKFSSRRLPSCSRFFVILNTFLHSQFLSVIFFIKLNSSKIIALAYWKLKKFRNLIPTRYRRIWNGIGCYFGQSDRVGIGALFWRSSRNRKPISLSVYTLHSATTNFTVAGLVLPTTFLF